MKKIDILVAVRNESENIIKFVDKIKKIRFDGIELSIVFLEDGSNDETLNILQALSKESAFVKYYSLKNDFGQYYALFFGITKSNADALITMDVDGGHPIYIIEGMIKEFLNGYNVVQGHRVQYKQKESYRSIASYIYNLFFLIFIGLNIVKQNSIFRLMDRKAYEIFRANFLLGYSLKTNFNQSDNIKINYISYDTPEREFGISKYSFIRLAGLSVRVAFSQLSKQRFFIFNFIFMITALISLGEKRYFGLFSSVLMMILIIIPYLSLRRTNPILKIKILESHE